eukprot:gnl/TRDRNA2_/TRDRNA2_133272_c0_seq3.p3 gnl/TRDRNA2_/TRDRNA2_133272_c0~~gnl/TRDRNA2_/TRDRNA2_133272_c0_seq3.p3  ORF type:complete len:177 (+),score=26.40 gnl/TRDRNA2_/TRDRNA2_133272_c0_seq3:167-697(+)
MEALASLRQEGYEVRPGDLGENITLEAPEAALSAGVCFRATAGTLLLELTEPITPCPNLEHVASVAALPERKRRAFPRACRGRRGWYARVLNGGTLAAGSSLTICCASAAEASECTASTPGDGTIRVRRWPPAGTDRAAAVHHNESDATSLRVHGAKRPERIRRWQPKRSPDGMNE